MQSDFTLWAAPLEMGYPSALLKKMMDKSIPIIHPYITVDHNEAHHQPRYKHYPMLGLLMEKEVDTDAADLEIITNLFRRTALNMKSRLSFTAFTDRPVEELARAITSSRRNSGQDAPAFLGTTGVQITPPARLTVFNGSPRGRKGNTPILLTKFLEGFSANPEHSYDLYHLNRLKESARFPQAFAAAECVLLGFPLYTDAMPGIVKAFIEQLEPFRGRASNPPIGFLIQSGFPEALHSRYVERYLEKLAARLGSPYWGSIVKGGGEGVRLMPEDSNRAIFDSLRQLGRTFGERGLLDPVLLKSLASPERFPAYMGPFYWLLTKTRSSTSYWDDQLKKNGVYERRSAQPYAGESSRVAIKNRA